jgi:hypothetical protein
VQAPLEAAFAELCLGAEIDAGNEADVRAWLQRHGVAEADVRHVLGSDIERLFVYRRLVRGNLWSAMYASIPRTMARMGPVFEEYFDRFLIERGPRTHYLRDAITELLDFCTPLWTADTRVPAYMAQLAQHEHAQIVVGSMLCGDATAEPAELDLDAGLHFIEAAKLMRYDWALHLLSEDEDNRDPPIDRQTVLLVYRNPEHEVRYLDLSPMAAAILTETLEQGQTLRAALTSACEARGGTLDEAVLGGTATLLADLAERGVLLGPAKT